eukprot:TRINITY_DN14886_c0_g3_i2.p2 TRINITY_DN14886_c0_g3~~TRINITY_DN14886_c0_g3_i2.p2  ORF type:complete len:348 (-),score=69.80 TRINITY_DN14886_c0_g3_i2:715-1758(-)
MQFWDVDDDIRAGFPPEIDDDLNDDFLYMDDFSFLGKKKKAKKPPPPPTTEKLKQYLEPCKPENTNKRQRLAAVKKYLKECEYWLNHKNEVVRYTTRNQEVQPYYTRTYADSRLLDDSKPADQIEAELNRLLNPVPTIADLILIRQNSSSLESFGQASKLLRHYGRRDNGRWATDPPIVRYARSGMLDKVKQLVNAGFDVNESLQWTEIGGTFNHKSWDWDGDNALMAAAREGHLHVVEYLLQNGAKRGHRCCVSDDEYEYPAQVARKKGYEKIAQMIEGESKADGSKASDSQVTAGTSQNDEGLGQGSNISQKRKTLCLNVEAAPFVPQTHKKNRNEGDEQEDQHE